MSHWACIYILFIFNAVIASSLSLPISNNKTSSDSPWFPNTSVGNLTADGVWCSAHHGDSMKLASCSNAWAKIDASSLPMEFRTRSRTVESPASSRLPLRWLSDDGICAIDVHAVGGSSGDISTGDQISEQAMRILHQCVVGRHMGGSVQGLGRSL